MGMYDTVSMTCPNCGSHTKYQSKCGPKGMKNFSIDTAPLFVIADLKDEADNDNLFCQDCGIEIGVEVQIKVRLVRVAGGESDKWRTL